MARASRLQSFETELLPQKDNPAGLAAVNQGLTAKVEAIDSARRVVPDADSTDIPVYGQQKHSAYNGRFESTWHELLLPFNRQGDGLPLKLRPGNMRSAEGGDELLPPEIERQQNQGNEVVFRADAAFGKPEIYAVPEERGVRYAVNLPANDGLDRDIAEMLTRPVGRPSHNPVVWYKSFLCQATSWKSARRVAGAQKRFRSQPPRSHFRDGDDRVEIWDADDSDPWQTLRWETVRVICYRQSKPNGEVIEAYWLTDFSSRRVSARSLYRIAKSRREIENQGMPGVATG